MKEPRDLSRGPQPLSDLKLTPGPQALGREKFQVTENKPNIFFNGL
jgi:hypothetical protein